MKRCLFGRILVIILGIAIGAALLYGIQQFGLKKFYSTQEAKEKYLTQVELYQNEMTALETKEGTTYNQSGTPDYVSYESLKANYEQYSKKAAQYQRVEIIFTVALIGAGLLTILVPTFGIMIGTKKPKEHK